MLKLLLAVTAITLTNAECPMVMCMMFCQNGFLLGDDGCPVCACNNTPISTPAPIPTNVGRGKCPTGCTSWYDGCNTCSCKNGRVGGCTKMACFTMNQPMCKAWSSNMATPAPTIIRCPLLGCNPMLTVGVDTDQDGCIDTCQPLVRATPTPIACPRLLGCNPMVTRPVDTDGDGCIDICQPLGTPAPTSSIPCPLLGCNPLVTKPMDTDGDGCIDVCQPLPGTPSPTPVMCPLLGCNPMVTRPVDTDGDGCIDICQPLKPATPAPTPLRCPLLGCNPMLTTAVDTDGDGCIDVCQPLPPTVFASYADYKTFMQGASSAECKAHGAKYKTKKGKSGCKVPKEKQGIKCKKVDPANCAMFDGCKMKKSKCKGTHKWN